MVMLRRGMSCKWENEYNRGLSPIDKSLIVNSSAGLMKRWVGMCPWVGRFALSELARSRLLTSIGFLSPALAVVAVVAIWPLGRTLWLAFTDASAHASVAPNYVGAKHFYELMVDPVWWQSVQNTALFAGISVSIELVLGVLFALLLNVHFRFNGLLRAAVLVPWAVPTVVSAKMWAWMFHDMYGVINEILLRMSLISEPLAWTADPTLSLMAVIWVDVWKTTPFMALLILAALQMVPRECYEAAKVDGVHPARVFFEVTLPLIRPALTVAVLFRLLDALRVFDVTYVLTSNSRDAMSMSMYARSLLVEFGDIGYGSALAVAVFVLVALASVVFITTARFRLQ
jgi:trehalose/maltose transport system permease protein